MFTRAAILAILLLNMSGICFADYLTPPSIQSFEISQKYYHLQYQEAIPDTESGWMTGLRLVYKNQDPDTREYWQIMYETTDHTDNYSGEYQNGTPLDATTANKITTTELITANPVDGTDNAYVYLGVGFHNWDRNIGPGSLLEKYSWDYIPIGYRNEFHLSSKWDGAVDVSFRLMFHGKMDAFIPSYDSSHLDLGNKTGFKLELPYTYHMNDSCSLVLTPYYEYWGIRQSDETYLSSGGVPAGYSVCEPDSHNNQYGINVGLIFKF